MPKLKTAFFNSLPAVIFSVFLVAVFVYAWTEPTSAPPGGNAPAPLNTSIDAQSKEGALVLGVNPAVTTGLVVLNGNVGIGTASPGYKLDVSGGDIRTGGEFRTTPNEGSCPLWKDCDGDGKTSGSGDCDEGCASCFVGSPPYSWPSSPDGLDQNCDEQVDDYVAGASKTCPSASGVVVDAAVASACQDWCAAQNLPFGSWSCDRATTNSVCYGFAFGDPCGANNCFTSTPTGCLTNFICNCPESYR